MTRKAEIHLNNGAILYVAIPEDRMPGIAYRAIDEMDSATPLPFLADDLTTTLVVRSCDIKAVHISREPSVTLNELNEAEENED